MGVPSVCLGSQKNIEIHPKFQREKGKRGEENLTKETGCLVCAWSLFTAQPNKRLRRNTMT